MYNKNATINLSNSGVYRNRTLKYIAPILRSYDKEFIKHINRLSIRGFTIGDMIYSNSLSDNIYLFVSRLNYRALFNTLSYLRDKNYYVDNFIINLKDHIHCIVIKNPRPKAIDYFLKGEYSKMYSQVDIDRFFLKSVVKNGVERYTDVYSILTRRPEFDNVFLETVNKDFDTDLDSLNTSEYDYPPIIAEEVINLQEEDLSVLIQRQQSLLDTIIGNKINLKT